MSIVGPADSQQPPNLPAQPVYVLRGHVAQIHAVEFIRSNAQLITGDADGWLVLWDIAIKRAACVWKAHESAILGASAWGNDKIISHGRDHRLRVWQIPEDTSNAALSKVLPVDDAHAHRPQPWLLHSLAVNTLNFCAFSRCAERLARGSPEDAKDLQDVNAPAPILIAVPGSLDSDSLPSEMRLHTIPVDKSVKTGMVMALKIVYRADRLAVIAGYESGHAMVFLQNPSSSRWERVYASQPHSQPVLSLDVAADTPCFLTSSADALIAKHPIPSERLSSESSKPLRTIQTKHAGRQGLSVRNDGKVFATAGWDSRVRVYAAKSMKELAVLKWHKEGCYATGFATVDALIRSAGASPRVAPAEEDHGNQSTKSEVVVRASAQSRNARARSTHWLAVGSKDGKVSLWDIY